MIYLIIGLVYVLINTLIRKIDLDDDWFLPIVWWTLWPIFAICWLVVLVNIFIEYILDIIADRI